eukprot:413141-Prymnesium_polylepis.1
MPSMTIIQLHVGIPKLVSHGAGNNRLEIDVEHGRGRLSRSQITSMSQQYTCRGRVAHWRAEMARETVTPRRAAGCSSLRLLGYVFSA